MLFCLAWGFIGSFISLALSRFLAKKLMGVIILNGKKKSKILEKVNKDEQLARSAKIPMPEVGIYCSDEVNAFATGPSKNRSLVAFSTELLKKFEKDEVIAVAAHEIAHIENGDMITMTLLQGVINAFVMFFARVIAYAASSYAKNERGATVIWYIVLIACHLIFGMLGAIITCWFSRKREYRADADAAKLYGAQSMIKALERLASLADLETKIETPKAMSAFCISSKKKAGFFSKIYSTHPDFEKRIEALKLYS
ncbi:UNVERIFIED_CONTAM: hypothetical protein GTU68_052432 [Idotea baltica]|nr:hypothetical protein [Idotea baltica]